MTVKYMTPWARVIFCVLIGALLGLAFSSLVVHLTVQSTEGDIEHDPTFYAVWGGERHPVWIVEHEGETYLLTGDLQGQCLTCQTVEGPVVQLSPQ